LTIESEKARPVVFTVGVMDTIYKAPSKMPCGSPSREIPLHSRVAHFLDDDAQPLDEGNGRQLRLFRSRMPTA
jgi:hypothetical protein